jgi:hypothetical protein
MPIRTKTHESLETAHPVSPSELEDIDYALFNHINDKMNVHCTTNKGFKKVPVIFSLAERAFQIKSDPSLRTDGKILIFPIISIERSSVTKDESNKGIYALNIPAVRDAMGGSITIARRVHQEKTSDRANADSIRKSASKENKNKQTSPGETERVVYESVSIPMPAYVHVSYSVAVRTEYMQQMNDILIPFITSTGAQNSFPVQHEGKKYEAFIEAEFAQENNSTSMGTEERTFQSTITIKVLGHLIGAGKNEEGPRVIVRQGAAEVKIQRERAITQDEIEFHLGKKPKIRG